MQLCSFVSIFPRDSLTHRQAAWASTGAALLLIHPLSIAFYTKSKKIWIILEEITVLPWSDVLIRCFNQISCQISFVIVSYIKVGEFQGKSHCWPKTTQRLVSYLANKSLYQDFWGNILWTDETKVELFGRCMSRFICHKTNTAFYKNNIIPTVEHGGGSVIIRGCFAALGPGWLAIIDGTMNYAHYQKILKENFRPWVCDLKLKRTWVM